MSDFETIRSLAEKLAALCAPESGATAGERDVAKRKLERLLERHGLTAADLAAEQTFTLKTLKAARKVAHLAIIAKNDIHPPDTPEGGKSLSPAKLAALVKAMQGLEKNCWEKPAGKVGDGVFALTNE